MNTVLIYMVLIGRAWTPQYVIEYPDEKACLAQASKVPNDMFSTTKAVCVPKLK